MRVTFAFPAQMERLPGRPSLSLNLAAPGSLFHHSPEWLSGSTATLVFLSIHLKCTFQFKSSFSLYDAVFALHCCCHNPGPPAATRQCDSFYALAYK